MFIYAFILPYDNAAGLWLQILILCHMPMTDTCALHLATKLETSWRQLQLICIVMNIFIY